MSRTNQRALVRDQLWAAISLRRQWTKPIKLRSHQRIVEVYTDANKLIRPANLSRGDLAVMTLLKDVVANDVIQPIHENNIIPFTRKGVVCGPWHQIGNDQSKIGTTVVTVATVIGHVGQNNQLVSPRNKTSGGTLNASDQK